MNYFQYNFGDIAVLTDGMGLIEYALFHKFVTRYLKTEKPIKTQWVSMAFPEFKDKAIAVLDATFVKNQGDSGEEWTNPALDELISGYRNKAEANRENGKKGGRPRKNNPTESEQNPVGLSWVAKKTQPEPNRNPTETLTNNQITNNQINVEKEVKEKDAIASPSLFLSEDESTKTGNVAVDVDKVVNLYNSILGNELPKCQKLTAKRKSLISKLWAEMAGYHKCKTTEEVLNAFTDYFERVRRIGFLKGENDRKWKADIEFVTRVDKWVNIIEGKYGNAEEKRNIFKVKKPATQATETKPIAESPKTSAVEFCKPWGIEGINLPEQDEIDPFKGVVQQTRKKDACEPMDEDILNALENGMQDMVM